MGPQSILSSDRAIGDEIHVDIISIRMLLLVVP
jgi:hypothetical protein